MYTVNGVVTWGGFGYDNVVVSVSSGCAIMLDMPRKQRRGKTVDASGTVLKAVRLELPEKTHYVLRVEAAKNQMSMAGYARKLIEDALARKTAAK